MEILKKEFLVKLIISICVLLMLFNFGLGNKTYAASGDEVTVGGKLLEPIVKLFTGIADGAMELLHTGSQGQGLAIIKLDGSQDWWEVLGTIFAIAIGILVAAVLIFSIGVAGAAIAAKLAAIGIGVSHSISLATVTAGVLSGVWVGVKAADWFFPDDIYLPAFTVGVQEIFSNKLPLFDVNFFEPIEDKDYGERTIALPDKHLSSLSAEDNSTYSYYSEIDVYEKVEIRDGAFSDDQYEIIEKIILDLNTTIDEKIDMTNGKYYISTTRERKN